MKIMSTGGGSRHMIVLAAAGTLNLALMAGPAHTQTSATRASPRNHYTLTTRAPTTSSPQFLVAKVVIVRKSDELSPP